MSVCLSSFNLLSSPDRLGEASESGGVAHVAVDVTFCVFLFFASEQFNNFIFLSQQSGVLRRNVVQSLELAAEACSRS